MSLFNLEIHFLKSWEILLELIENFDNFFSSLFSLWNSYQSLVESSNFLIVLLLSWKWIIPIFRVVPHFLQWLVSQHKNPYLPFSRTPQLRYLEGYSLDCVEQRQRSQRVKIVPLTQICNPTCPLNFRCAFNFWISRDWQLEAVSFSVSLDSGFCFHFLWPAKSISPTCFYLFWSMFDSNSTASLSKQGNRDGMVLTREDGRRAPEVAAGCCRDASRESSHPSPCAAPWHTGSGLDHWICDLPMGY